MANPQEYNRVEELRLKQERLIYRQFELYVKRSTTPEILEQVEQLVNVANLEPVLTQVDKYVEQFSNVLADTFIAAAQAETDVWLGRFGVVTKASQFNVTNRRVTEFLTNTRDNFIRNLTRQQRSTVRRALLTGLQQGKTPKQIARMFEDAIGLTPEQYQMVESYRTALDRGSTAALRRELRSTRYDDRLSTAIEEGEVLPQKQIDRMVNAYARNLKRHRAVVIAQTESLRMTSRARDEAVKQAAEAAGKDVRRGVKTWNTTLDGRERATHHAMDDQTVGIDEPFVSPSGARLMFPGDSSLGAGAAEIINCRCNVSYSFEE